MAAAHENRNDRLSNSLPLQGSLEGSTVSTFENHICIGKYVFTRDGKCITSDVKTRQLIPDAKSNALLGADLRAGYENAVLVSNRGILNTLKQKSFLHWVAESNFFPGVNEGKFKKPDFICFSDLIANSLKSPLSRSYSFRGDFNWTLFATRDHDAIYLCGSPKPAKEFSENRSRNFNKNNKGSLSNKVLAGKPLNKDHDCNLSMKVKEYTISNQTQETTETDPSKEVLEPNLLEGHENNLPSQFLDAGLPGKIQDVDETSPSNDFKNAPLMDAYGDNLSKEAHDEKPILHANLPKEIKEIYTTNPSKGVHGESLSKELLVGKVSRDDHGHSVSKEVHEDNLSVPVLDCNLSKEVQETDESTNSNKVLDSILLKESHKDNLSEQVLGCNLSKEVQETDKITSSKKVLDSILLKESRKDNLSKQVLDYNPSEEVQTNDESASIEGLDNNLSKEIHGGNLSKEVFDGKFPKEVPEIEGTHTSREVHEDTSLIEDPKGIHTKKDQVKQESNLSKQVLEGSLSKEFRENEPSKEDVKRDYWTYSGLYFQHILTQENPQETILDEYHKVQWVSEISFGEHQLLCVSGMNAEDENGEGVDMVLSTSTSRFKNIEYWARNVVPGRKTLISGYRNESMLLNHIERTLIKDIPLKFGWNPDRCYEFTDRLLSWIKSHFKENNPKIVKKFSWSVRHPSHVFVSDVKEGEIPDLLLPQWYIEAIQCQMAGQ